MGELKEAEEELSMLGSPLAGMLHQDIIKLEAYASNPRFKKDCDEYIKRLSRVESADHTLKMTKRSLALHYHNKPKTESEEVGAQERGAIPSSRVTSFENVTDVSGEDPDTSSAGSHVISSIMSSSMLKLDDFPSRPVQILTVSLTNTTDITASVDPWTTLTGDPSYRAKLRNYGFFKADLHVRLNLSGTQFHYGRVLVAYVPSHLTNEPWQAYLTQANQATVRPAILKYLIQTYGAKLLNVTDNRPVDMHIPLVVPCHMLKLFNNATGALAAGTAYEDVGNIGCLYIYTLNQIQCIQASPSTCTLEVYANFENVEWGCPTGSVQAITTEADDIPDERPSTESEDERKIGPVESLATAAATVAGALSKVPQIAPLAKASQMILSGLAGIASWFGWSTPVVTNMHDPIIVKNTPYQNAVNLIGYDTGFRIGVDPKQELTIDPRVGGVSEDEMTIAALCRKWSLLDIFTWSHSEAILGAPMWEAVVHPRARVPISLTAMKLVQPTTLDFAVTPFNYWRGDIEYMFDFVASGLHRGKVLICYEPNTAQQVLIDGTRYLNKQFTKIVDLQTTQRATFCVEWALNRPWAPNLANTALEGSVGSLTTLTTKWQACNGYISVTALTTLQSPNNGDIYVNVFVRSKNMMVNFPTTTFFPTQRVITESEDLFAEEETCLPLNPTGASTKAICDLHFGELPISFRALLKRFATTNYATAVSSLIDGMAYTAEIIPPLLPNYTTNSTYSPSLLNYLRYAYLCMRGGIRKRAHFVSNTQMPTMGQVKVTLYNPASSTTAFAVSASTVNTPQYSYLEGTLEFVPTTNTGIEFEIPFYTNNLYAWANNVDPFSTTSNTIMNGTATRNYLITLECGVNSNIFPVIETATAEDFSLFRFVASPPYTY